MNNIVPYADIIIQKTNERIKYIADITIDPNSKQFIHDLKDLANIIFSIEMTNNNKSVEKYINSVSNELTRKTIKNLIKELYSLRNKTKTKVMHTNINDVLNTQSYFNDIFNDNLNRVEEQPIIQTTDTNISGNQSINLITNQSTNNKFLLNFDKLGLTKLDMKLDNIMKINISSVEFAYKNFGKDTIKINGVEVKLIGCNSENILNCIKYIDNEIKENIDKNISINFNVDTNMVIFEYATTNNKIHNKNDHNLCIDFTNCKDFANLIGYVHPEYTCKDILISNKPLDISSYNTFNLKIYVNDKFLILKENIPLDNSKINDNILIQAYNNLEEYLNNKYVENVTIKTIPDMSNRIDVNCILEFNQIK